jgi:LmbE family N-acetylglucosaminyl deacetylase
VPALDLRDRTVLAIFAHPDDESLACGGTLARLSDAGARVVLLCASQGERGYASVTTPAPDPEIGRARVDELHHAAQILGISDVVILDHPDGDLRWADVPQLHAEIVTAIREYRADAVITFAEDGLYWHLDHIGVHERTKTAVASLADEAPALYYVTMRKGAMHEIVETALANGWSPPTRGFWSIVPNAFGVVARRPSFVVDVGDWIPRKMSALLCHRTQMGHDNPFKRLSAADARALLGTEQFRRARPHTGISLLEQLGEPVVRPERRRV